MRKPDQLLEEAYAKNDKKLKRLDRNFIKELVYGSLRWHSKLYWILQNTSKRDLDKSPPEVVAALVVATYQIYYMDRVPDRAAVNESVEYVRQKGQASACSFVNGILRQIARRAEYFRKPDKIEEPVKYLCIQYAHPEWLVRRWHRHFKFDRLEQMLSMNNTAPVMTIRLNALKIPIENGHDLQAKLLKEESIHSDRRPLRSAFHVKQSPRLGQGSLFAQGLFTIQDESAQLISYLVDPGPQETIVDGCAGAAGKLSHIYELSQGEANLIAIEKEERHLHRGQKALERLGHQGIVWHHQDFLDFTPEKAPDKILLDAPCSGLGILRRHPEGKLQKTEKGIHEKAQLQWQLIEHALSILKVGGELIYAVCSSEPEESDDHMQNLLNQRPDQIEFIDPGSRIPDYYRKYVLKERVFVVFPGNQEHMDGFAAFIVKRKA